MIYDLHDSGRIQVYRYPTHHPFPDGPERDAAIDQLLDALDTAAIGRALNRRGLLIYDVHGTTGAP